MESKGVNRRRAVKRQAMHRISSHRGKETRKDQEEHSRHPRNKADTATQRRTHIKNPSHPLTANCLGGLGWKNTLHGFSRKVRKKNFEKSKSQKVEKWKGLIVNFEKSKSQKVEKSKSGRVSLSISKS